MIGRRARFALLLAAACSFSFGVLHCGAGVVAEIPSSSPDGSPQFDAGGGDTGPVGSGHVPLVHRPSPIACPAARDPGYNLDGGRSDSGAGESCARDLDCTSGSNGRCLRYSRINTYYCSYDVCANDSACPTGQTCNCGAAGTPSRAGNACLSSNCRVDGDCGVGNYCSPSLDPSCGSYIGITGLYCHSAVDECTNDADCTDMGPGFCAFTPMVSKWTCHYGICAG